MPKRREDHRAAREALEQVRRAKTRYGRYSEEYCWLMQCIRALDAESRRTLQEL